MNLLPSLADAYRDSTVLVTGHSGFKGSWLCEWLLLLGARVVGIALPPDTTPALFDQLQLSQRVEHHILDIRDRQGLARCVLASEPDYVFHLAAQPLVRRSYIEPVETYATNMMGTVHLLDALRQLDDHYRRSERACAAVFITTDKCYENREWLYGYREDDHLGGYDPYSSSKASAEIAIAAYRRSYFNPETSNQPLRIGIASARAGNVIGGGDWAHDRIVPDCIRHLQRGEPIPVRNPAATRPWQHVLEPLGGYLRLAALQRRALEISNPEALLRTCAAYNFGPALNAQKPVSALVEQILMHWPGRWEDHSDPDALHEAERLNLCWDRAFHQLGWKPSWNFSTTIRRTIEWYRHALGSPSDCLKLTQADIRAYET